MHDNSNELNTYDKKVVLLYDEDDFVAVESATEGTALYHRKSDIQTLSRSTSNEYFAKSSNEDVVTFGGSKQSGDSTNRVETGSSGASSENNSMQYLTIQARQLGVGIVIFFVSCTALSAVFGTIIITPVIAWLGIIIGSTYIVMGSIGRVNPRP